MAIKESTRDYMIETQRIARECMEKLETVSLLISEVEEYYKWGEAEDYFDEIDNLIGYLIDFIYPDL